MAVLDDLKAAIAKLSGDVDTLLARPAQDPTAVPAADVQAAADSVTAIDAKVSAAVTPPSS